ncbi:hypothetical protein AAFF_G00056810 [Aldrovandia affinis]|uniref:Uncharacterized protein n=1 Tax=Aldrovandia affinis TaxID=143900 RepID=A0AAD7S0I0_9TELE|nr:hypothetical protein AAFF_G00056810 [Aldrovandia affinis]
MGTQRYPKARTILVTCAVFNLRTCSPPVYPFRQKRHPPSLLPLNRRYSRTERQAKGCTVRICGGNM